MWLYWDSWAQAFVQTHCPYPSPFLGGMLVVQGVPFPACGTPDGHHSVLYRRHSCWEERCEDVFSGGNKGVFLQPTPPSAQTALLLPWKLPVEHHLTTIAGVTGPPLSPASPGLQTQAHELSGCGRLGVPSSPQQ